LPLAFLFLFKQAAPSGPSLLQDLDRRVVISFPSPFDQCTLQFFSVTPLSPSQILPWIAFSILPQPLFPGRANFDCDEPSYLKQIPRLSADFFFFSSFSSDLNKTRSDVLFSTFSLRIDDVFVSLSFTYPYETFPLTIDKP